VHSLIAMLLAVPLPILQELLTHRTWDVTRHPQWLVFEAEGRLQIRPAQHALAVTLLDGEDGGPGPIAQLNMGEGKTRVILPMVILELANGRNLVRMDGIDGLDYSMSMTAVCMV
jgi:hypothetical protein